MSLSRIASYSWVALLSRFGINVPPAFDLTSTVVPVVIVDSSIPISVQAQLPLLGVPASAGEVLNPAANTRLADTGALAAGNWTFYVLLATDQTNAFRLRRRNAADAADIWSSFIRRDTNSQSIWSFRSVIAANERLVLENIVIGVGTYQASIFATPA